MDIALRLTLLSVLYCISLLSWAESTNERELENHIKAVFLYKFTDYVEWPSSVFPAADAPFTIGVVGADEVAAELLTLSKGNWVNNRTILIRRLDATDSWEDLQILFIGKNERGRLRELLSQVQSKPVLTVTESQGALDAGSIINFIPVQDYIRFEISVASADSQGIKISARLLDVAQNIEGRRQQ